LLDGQNKQMTKDRNPRACAESYLTLSACVSVTVLALSFTHSFFVMSIELQKSGITSARQLTLCTLEANILA